MSAEPKLIVLVLRPEPGAGATCRRAAAMGIVPVSTPLFVARALDWRVPTGDPDSLLVTSAQAMRLGGAGLAALIALPVYAVGEATAAAARAADFAQVHAGSGDAAAIVAAAAADGRRRMLHLAGRERRAVGHPGITIDTVAVYAADAVDTLPAGARDALGGGAVALLHSARAAALFARLSDATGMARAAVRIAAISPAARAAAGGGWAAAAAAADPTDTALLAAARGLCD